MRETVSMNFDYSGLSGEQKTAVQHAVANRSNVYGAEPTDETFSFIMKNFGKLAAIGILEETWLSAYLHGHRCNEYGLVRIKAVFDACDRSKLLTLKPLLADQKRLKRISAFRGCAGPDHTLGMSWTSSLDQAIFYATRHADRWGLTNLAVYAATFEIDEIYCRLDHYEEEFIVVPAQAWRVEVPPHEFRLNRPR